MAPDLRRKVDAARAARLAREAEMKKQVEAQVSVATFVLFCLFFFFFLLSSFWKFTPHIPPYNFIIPPFETEARHGSAPLYFLAVSN